MKDCIYLGCYAIEDWEVLDASAVDPGNSLRVVAPENALVAVAPVVALRSLAAVDRTLTFQINVHIRLFIFQNIAVLYGLIRVYTFIRFVSNPAYTIFIWSMFISLNIFNIFEVILRSNWPLPRTVIKSPIIAQSLTRLCATVLGQTASC